MLSPDETAEFVAEVGWDGIECPVREKGQIQPERVEEDLPRLVEALEKRKLSVKILATDIKNPSQPFTQKVLRTAVALGIRKYRTAFWVYDANRPIPEQLREIGAELRDLAALNKELGVQAGFQNHSGVNMVGAAIWDIYEMIKQLDPKSMGILFDIGHATLEGGLSWPTQARLMRPYYTAVHVQDFSWQQTGSGWKPEWRPLGEGAVNKSFFTTLLKSGYDGIFSQKHEYPLKSRAEMLGAMKKDLVTLRAWLSEAK